MNMIGLLKGKVIFEGIKPALTLIRTGAEVIIAFVAIAKYRSHLTVNKDERKVANEKVKSENGLSNLNTPHMATVLAWSHCRGYARNVFPELGNKIKKSEFYKKGPFPVKEFNLITQSGKTIEDLKELKLPDKYDLQNEGKLEDIKASRGSVSDRLYTPTVYSITDPLTGKKYYFVAHIPNSLSILSRLEQMGEITKDQRINEMRLFRIALPRIVEMTVDESCSTLFTQIYIEENATLDEKAQKILNTVIDECQEKENSEMHNSSLIKPSNEHDVKSVNDNTNQPKVVDRYNPEEKGKAEKVKKMIEEKGHKNETGTSKSDWKDNTNQPTVVDIDYYEDIPEEKGIADKVRKMIEEKCRKNETGTSKSDLKVIVLSKKRLERMSFKVEKWIAQVDKNLTKQGRMIAILTDDLSRDKCPDGLSILVDVFLQSNDPALREKVLKEVESDRNRRLCIPETAYRGLAYSYVFNYLEKLFGENAETYAFDKRFDEIHTMYADKSLFRKLMIIVPNSFLKREKKDLEKEGDDRNVPGFRKVDKFPWEILPGEVVGSKYEVIAYNVQEKWWKAIFHLFSGRKEFMIVGEYPNPLVLLSEIQKEANWDDKKLQEEVDGFITLTEELIKKNARSGKVSLLKFSDKKGHTIRDELINFLEQQKPEYFVWADKAGVSASSAASSAASAASGSLCPEPKVDTVAKIVDSDNDSKCSAQKP